MSDIPDRLIQIAELRWREPLVGAVISLVVGTIVFLNSSLILASGITLLTFGLWAFSIRLTRVSKGKIGFVIAIFSENDSTEKKIRADFVDSIRTLFPSTKGPEFQLVELPRAVSRRVLDDPSYRDKLLRKLRAHFMLYGRVRQRTFQKREAHYLNLEGIVRHRETTDELKDELRNDFARVLPRRMIVDMEDDV